MNVLAVGFAEGGRALQRVAVAFIAPGVHGNLHLLLLFQCVLDIVWQVFHHYRLQLRQLELLRRLQIVNSCEVDTIEELVAHQIVQVRGAQPELRVHGEQFSYEVLG